MKKSVFIAIEERGTAILLSQQLEASGFLTREFDTLTSLLAELENQQVDLIVLGQSGGEEENAGHIERIRKQSSVPLIALSSPGSLSERVSYLQNGADDVLTKPFSPIELTARVKSLLRRVEIDRSAFEEMSEQTENTLAFANMRVDLSAQQIACNDTALHLTQMEFDVFSYLLKHQHRAISRKELLEKVWYFETDIQTRATDDMIKRMRKKLIASGANVKIETIWGYGFKLKKKDQPT